MEAVNRTYYKTFLVYARSSDLSLTLTRRACRVMMQRCSHNTDWEVFGENWDKMLSYMSVSHGPTGPSDMATYAVIRIINDEFRRLNAPFAEEAGEPEDA